MTRQARLARTLRSPFRPQHNRSLRHARQWAESQYLSELTGIAMPEIAACWRETRTTRPAGPKYAAGDYRARKDIGSLK